MTMHATHPNAYPPDSFSGSSSTHTLTSVDAKLAGPQPIEPFAKCPPIIIQARKTQYQPMDSPHATRFTILCHPDVDAVCAEVDGFFAKHWSWSNESAREEFLKTDPSRWTCLVFPFASNDRVRDAAMIDTLFFLLDDIFEELSIEDAKTLLQRLMTLAMGKAEPDRSDPQEWITFDVCATMRAVDEALAEGVVQGLLLYASAQANEERNRCEGLGAVLQQRYKDSAASFITGLMAYALDLHLSPAELESIAHIDYSYAKLAIIGNDIVSYDKERRAAERYEAADDKARNKMLNMVQMQADETGCSIAAAKRMLWVLCREWEVEHLEMVREREARAEGCSEALKAYMKGIEYVLGGNELWGCFSKRYNQG